MMKKSTYILSVVFLLISTIQLDAQRNNNRQERMDALKIAFITEELDLSIEEWQMFWPIYNKHHKAQQSLQEEMEFKIEEAKLSGAEAVLDLMLEIESQKLDLKKEYISQLASATSAETVVSLLELERVFKHKLLRKIQKRKGGI